MVEASEVDAATAVGVHRRAAVAKQKAIRVAVIPELQQPEALV